MNMGTLKNMAMRGEAVVVKPLECPEGATTRDGNAVTVTAAGLAFILASATEGALPGGIAAALGIGRAEFKSLMGKTPILTAVGRAFEAGHDTWESDMHRVVTVKAKAGDTLCATYLLKKEGHRDTGPLVEIDTGNKIQFILPGAYPTEEAYMASIGQTAIIDTRDPAKKAEHERALGRAPALLGAPIESNMIDVTPAPPSAQPRQGQAISPTFGITTPY